MSDLNTDHTRVVWLDIPVADLDRACRFYEGVLGIGPHGFRALFVDSEGNRFALHSHEDR